MCSRLKSRWCPVWSSGWRGAHQQRGHDNNSFTRNQPRSRHRSNTCDNTRPRNSEGSRQRAGDVRSHQHITRVYANRSWKFREGFDTAVSLRIEWQICGVTSEFYGQLQDNNDGQSTHVARRWKTYVSNSVAHLEIKPDCHAADLCWLNDCC